MTKKKEAANQTSFLLYTSANGDIKVDVRLQDETIWLTQKAMAELFAVGVPAVNKHLKNIFDSEELEENSVISILEITASDGKNYKTKYYNLDAIISVGYRVNSKRAVQFRQWATNVLRQHLVEGYTLNQHRLQERGVDIEQALGLLTHTLQNQQLIAEQGVDILKVVADYARSWSLLQRYDEQSLPEVTSKQQAMRALELDAVLAAISELKCELIRKGEATELFGQLRGDGLHSAIGTIEQTFGGDALYPNIASRAANLLYFVIKNHPLADGNKRTGSFLFLWYLRLNENLLAKPVEQLINDNTLVALALLVAESQPKQKDLMIRLIEHFILLKN